MRKSYEELNELCKKNNTDRLWSWSRINSVHNSLYEYYLNYIVKVKPDRDDSIYVVTGSSVHDILERFYNNEIKYEDMAEEFDDAWTTAFDIADLKFDRSSSEKNNSIADKYYQNIMHFFKHHKVIPTKLVTEQFVTSKFGNEFTQGYLDALTRDFKEDDTVTIIDWKSSSIYKGEKAQNECGQLVMYAIALNQKGIPYNKIRICWDFLKYSNVTVQMKNGTSKVRQIERCKIGESLVANAKMWLKEFGYEDSTMDYVDALIETNDISCLPKEVQDKFEFDDCFVYVDLTEELIKHWSDYIVDTIAMIRDKEKEYEKTKNEHIWWESEEDVKKQSFYFSNLCSYSANLHKPYAAYLQKLDNEKNGGLLGVSKKKESNNSDSNNTDDEFSLDWLNEL